MIKDEEKRIIEDYIEAYNAFDVEAMLSLLSPDVQFKNISNGVVDTEASGIDELRRLAIQSASLFSERKQTITAWKKSGEWVEVAIDYQARLKADLPNGLKAGDRLALKGRSTFRLKAGRIAAITDES